jgi:hypothetical protein
MRAPRARTWSVLVEDLRSRVARRQRRVPSVFSLWIRRHWSGGLTVERFAAVIDQVIKGKNPPYLAERDGTDAH